MNREFTKNEYKIVDKALEYIAIIPRCGCRIYWDKRTAFGRYQALSDKIYLMDQRDCLDEMMPCIVHELTHRVQRKRYGLIIFSLMNLTRCILEKEAVRNEHKAELLMNINL